MESRIRNAREALTALVPRAYHQQLGHARLVERASDRKIRARNKISYRLNHWPIWILTFFIAPGPLTFDLFAHGFDRRIAAWLGIVLAGTGIAGLAGKLPGVEPAPYIIRFTEDKPNPLYRRICYTFAWSAVITFAVLNIAGLVWRSLRARGGSGRSTMRRTFPSRERSGRSGSWACCRASGRLQGRGPRTPLLLWLRVGRVRRAAGALAFVDRSAARRELGHAQACRLRGDPRLRRQPCASRTVCRHAADRPRRNRSLRLIGPDTSQRY